MFSLKALFHMAALAPRAKRDRRLDPPKRRTYKFWPHQGAREVARRRDQIARGTLQTN